MTQAKTYAEWKNENVAFKPSPIHPTCLCGAPTEKVVPIVMYGGFAALCSRHSESFPYAFDVNEAIKSGEQLEM